MWNSVKKALQQRRFHLTFMLFFGFFNLYVLRINLSVAIVAMTEGTQSGFEGDFDWNSKEQGFILSSFYYGYLLSLFASGILASKIGGRRLFGFGVFGTAILTLLTPMAAKAGLGYLIVIRAIKGTFGGMCYPSLHAIWAKWAPPLERSQHNGFAFAGMYAGTVVIMPLAGTLSEHLGWEWVFYSNGIFACLWFILWIFWIKESPEDDKFITDEEKKYILESLENEKTEKSTVKTPWKAIFTSGPVLAICVANFAEDWGYYTMLTQLPTYLHQTIDKISLESNGLISALPYVALTLFTFPVSFFADWSRKNEYLTTTQVRKILQCSGLLGEGFLLILAALLNHHVYSIICIVFAVGLGSFSTSGAYVNALDIAPQFASIIMGLSNSIGTVSGIVSPILTGFIVQDAEPWQWSIVFAIAAIIYFSALIVYFCLGSGELQQWAEVGTKDTAKHDKEVGTEAKTEPTNVC